MTKTRPPHSFEMAVTRVAGRLGFDRCAAVLSAAGAGNVAERTVRAWSDPGVPALPSLDQALILDLEFRRDGGGEAPILAVFARLLDAGLEPSPDQQQLARAGARAAVEAGQAVAAILTASQPGATRQVLAVAEHEIEEAQVAFGDALAHLRPPASGP
jgi:hypothetical protein